MFYFSLFLFFTSFFVSLISTPFLMKIAKKKQLFDVYQGDELKIHKASISYFGGLAMVLSTIVVLVLIGFYQKNFYWQIIGIISGALIIFLLGFWDDLKWKHISKIKPRKKFALLIICSLLSAVFLVVSGTKINFFPRIYFAIILTWAYIFVLINAVNYQDGIDGLAGGLTAISLLGFITLSVFTGNTFSLFFSLILLGSVFGFLVFNFPPAKIFMGDSGAYFLGFILAVMAAIFSEPYNLSNIFGPIFIIGLPIFDGVVTNIRRLLGKKSIFLGDREHFYDRIHLKRGFSVKKTILICYVIQAIFVVIGLLIFNL